MNSLDDRQTPSDENEIYEADQLPVKCPKDKYCVQTPLCNICSGYVDMDDFVLRFLAGVYSDAEMVTDGRCWRHEAWHFYYCMSKFLILCHPRKPVCRLSGISYFSQADFDFYTLQVPWDERTGIVRSKSTDKRLLVTGLRDEASSRYDPSRDRLRGLAVHDRCWQVLRSHKIWELAGGDINLVKDALQRRNARDWETPLDGLGIRIHAHSCNDPFCSSHSGDVVAIQEAMGFYLGDAYWRSKIPSKLFHEVKDLWDQPLDWQFLFLEFERLEDHPWYGSDLLGRKWVLR
ncbi:hypothetical protein BDW62DRAFT_213475 [Aspergillus aurantiobrunneus]